MSAAISEAIAKVPDDYWWSISKRKQRPRKWVIMKRPYYAAVGKNANEGKTVDGYGEADAPGDALHDALKDAGISK